jgi:hypothetical protein
MPARMVLLAGIVVGWVKLWLGRVMYGLLGSME